MLFRREMSPNDAQMSDNRSNSITLKTDISMDDGLNFRNSLMKYNINTKIESELILLNDCYCYFKINLILINRKYLACF